jgi:hypothetical protein
MFKILWRSASYDISSWISVVKRCTSWSFSGKSKDITVCGVKGCTEVEMWLMHSLFRS